MDPRLRTLTLHLYLLPSLLPYPFPALSYVSHLSFLVKYLSDRTNIVRGIVKAAGCYKCPFIFVTIQCCSYGGSKWNWARTPACSSKINNLPLVPSAQEIFLVFTNFFHNRPFGRNRMGQRDRRSATIYRHTSNLRLIIFPKS